MMAAVWFSLSAVPLMLAVPIVDPAVKVAVATPVTNCVLTLESVPSADVVLVKTPPDVGNGGRPARFEVDVGPPELRPSRSAVTVEVPPGATVDGLALLRNCSQVVAV